MNTGYKIVSLEVIWWKQGTYPLQDREYRMISPHTKRVGTGYTQTINKNIGWSVLSHKDSGNNYAHPMEQRLLDSQSSCKDGGNKLHTFYRTENIGWSPASPEARWWEQVTHKLWTENIRWVSPHVKMVETNKLLTYYEQRILNGSVFMQHGVNRIRTSYGTENIGRSVLNSRRWKIPWEWTAATHHLWHLCWRLCSVSVLCWLWGCK